MVHRAHPPAGLRRIPQGMVPAACSGEACGRRLPGGRPGKGEDSLLGRASHPLHDERRLRPCGHHVAEGGPLHQSAHRLLRRAPVPPLHRRDVAARRGSLPRGESHRLAHRYFPQDLRLRDPLHHARLPAGPDRVDLLTPPGGKEAGHPGEAQSDSPRIPDGQGNARPDRLHRRGAGRGGVRQGPALRGGASHAPAAGRACCQGGEALRGEALQHAGRAQYPGSASRRRDVHVGPRAVPHNHEPGGEAVGGFRRRSSHLLLRRGFGMESGRNPGRRDPPRDRGHGAFKAGRLWQAESARRHRGAACRRSAGRA
jgi:hypothetical protein